jgi:hypothetical protein
VHSDCTKEKPARQGVAIYNMGDEPLAANVAHQSGQAGAVSSKPSGKEATRKTTSFERLEVDEFVNEFSCLVGPQPTSLGVQC